MTDLYYNPKLYNKLISFGIDHKEYPWAVNINKFAAIIWGTTEKNKRMNKITVTSGQKIIEYYLTSDSYKLFEQMNSMLKIRLNDQGNEYGHIIEIMTVLSLMGTKITNKDIVELMSLYSSLAYSGAVYKNIDNQEILNDIISKGIDYYVSVKFTEQQREINTLRHELESCRLRVHEAEIQYSERLKEQSEMCMKNVLELMKVNETLREENTKLFTANNTFVKFQNKLLQSDNIIVVHKIPINTINDVFSMIFRGKMMGLKSSQMEFINDNFIESDGDSYVYYITFGVDNDYKNNVHTVYKEISYPLNEFDELFSSEGSVLTYRPLKKIYDAAVIKIDYGVYLSSDDIGLLIRSPKCIVDE